MVAFSDEILMAFADGELDAETAERVAISLKFDAALQQRYLAYARTSRQLAEVYAPVLEEEVPAHLIAAIYREPAAASPQPARRTSFSPDFGRWLARYRPANENWGSAIAASILAIAVGLGIGWPLFFGVDKTNNGGSAGLVVAENDGLHAAGALAAALETAPSAAPHARATASLQVTPRLTFRTAAGGYCRQYIVSGTADGAFEGVACRKDGGIWVIKAHAQAKAPAPAVEGTVPASGPGAPAEIEAVVDGLISGDVLALPEEASLLEGKWHRAD